MRMKVCMFVLNPCTNDARVLKEATTLGKAGYDVKIIAITSSDAPDLIDEKDNFAIYRVQPRGLLTYLKTTQRTLKTFNRRSKHILFFFIKIWHREKIDLNNSEETNFIKKVLNKVANLILMPLIIFSAFMAQWKFFTNTTKKIKGKLLGYHRISTYISYWIKSKNLALSFKADVYHAHDLNTLLPAYLAAKKIGAKVIYDSHELYTERNTLFKQTAFSKWVINKLEAFLIRKANTVITVNESIAVELSNLYNIPVPSIVMNCPDYRIGIRNNLLREMIQLNGNLKIILYLGAITFNRGLEETMTAMGKVNKGVLVVMGYGKPEYISSLKQKSSQLGVKERLYFIPAVPPHEVVKYAASADIGIVPIQNACKSYYYCSPNKLFESMMAGLPVAASDFPELRRVIEETNCGYFFNPSDTDDIANTLNKMLSDDKTSKQMRHNALLYAHRYSWEKESKKLLSIYARLFES